MMHGTEEVRSALTDVPKTINQIISEIYPDVPSYEAYYYHTRINRIMRNLVRDGQASSIDTMSDLNMRVKAYYKADSIPKDMTPMLSDFDARLMSCVTKRYAMTSTIRRKLDDCGTDARKIDAKVREHLKTMERRGLVECRMTEGRYQWRRTR